MKKRMIAAVPSFYAETARQKPISAVAEPLQVTLPMIDQPATFTLCRDKKRRAFIRLMLLDGRIYRLRIPDQYMTADRADGLARLVTSALFRLLLAEANQ